jgi:hypothetical protein
MHIYSACAIGHGIVAELCRHAVAEALECIEQSAGFSADLAAACSHLSSLLTTADAAQRQQNLAVSLRAGITPKLLLMAQRASSAADVSLLCKLLFDGFQLTSNRDMFAEKVCLLCYMSARCDCQLGHWSLSALCW